MKRDGERLAGLQLLLLHHPLPSWFPPRPLLPSWFLLPLRRRDPSSWKLPPVPPKPWNMSTRLSSVNHPPLDHLAAGTPVIIVIAIIITTMKERLLWCLVHGRDPEVAEIFALKSRRWSDSWYIDLEVRLKEKLSAPRDCRTASWSSMKRRWNGQWPDPSPRGSRRTRKVGCPSAYQSTDEGVHIHRNLRLSLYRPVADEMLRRTSPSSRSSDAEYPHIKDKQGVRSKACATQRKTGEGCAMSLQRFWFCTDQDGFKAHVVGKESASGKSLLQQAVVVYAASTLPTNRRGSFEEL